MTLRTPRPSTRRAAATAAVVLTVLALAACGPEDPAATGTPTPATTPGVTLPTSDAQGGTLRALSLGPATTWDPQRISSRQDMSVAGRLFARTLTAYAVDGDPGGQTRLVGDLATSTGKASKDLRTWTFPLRQGVRWEDGSPVTCADIKYGISRTFATKDVPGGPAYALAVLDIPKKPDGTSSYVGPYDTSPAAAAGRKAFDRAVSCSGPNLVVRLAAPTSDFAEMVTLPAFGPYRRADDQRGGGTFLVQSSGPYVLKGAWQAGKGGTFVRNPAWSADTDPVRRALPDRIEVVEGVETPVAVQQVTADGGEGRAAVTLGSAPPALQQQVLAATALHPRTVNPRTGLVDYLVPNIRSQVFRTSAARRALALATDREAYVNALGGGSAADPAVSLIPAPLRRGEPAAVPTSAAPAPTATGSGSATATAGGGTDDLPTDAPTASGSPTSTTTTTTATGEANPSLALLRAAGLSTPVRIKVAYRAGETADKAMAALVAGWREGGFDPVLEPIDADYFTRIASPQARGYDVLWSYWAPEWASASTILPPLFDSRINLSAAGTGRDYGYFSSAAFNARVDAISAVADRERRETLWAALDDTLVKDAVYIGLAQRRAMYVAGSSVRNFSGNEVAGGFVELSGLGVQ